jgi:hypothetical protein
VIPRLDAATVVPRHERDSTTYDVLPADAQAPVLRLFKPTYYDSLQPLTVLAGPGLDQQAGWVSAKSAAGPDRVKLGSVEQRSRFLTSTHSWTFDQVGLGRLTGRPEGAGSKLLHGSPLGALPFTSALDMVVEYQVVFRGDGCEGFGFTRLKGAQPRYALRLHDPRVSLLLALATIVRYDWLLSPNPKGALLDLTCPTRA